MVNRVCEMLLNSFPSSSSKKYSGKGYIASGSGDAFIMVLLSQVSFGRGRRRTRWCCLLDLRVFPCAGITRPLSSHPRLPRRGEDHEWLRKGTSPAGGEAAITPSNLSTPAPPSKPSLRPLLLLGTPPLRLRCHCLGGRGSGLAGTSVGGKGPSQGPPPVRRMRLLPQPPACSGPANRVVVASR